jgi:two-component system, chemotaxis family, CheB/CheR fusion protein
MRVLLVDDNTDAVQMASALFALDGHIVTVASDPHQALGHASATRPEVVILDIGMPGMNGYELARAIRALNLKPRPLIIAVSGYTSAGDIKRGIEAGFDFHYPKTIDPNVIVKTVNMHAGRMALHALNNESGKPH